MSGFKNEVMAGLLLLATFAGSPATIAETNDLYGYRAYAGEMRKLFTQTHEIDLRLHGGEISHGEAATLKFRARQYHLDAVARLRAQHYAVQRDSAIQRQQYLQQQSIRVSDVITTTMATTPDTGNPAVTDSESGIFLTESAGREGKICFYSVLRGIRTYNTFTVSPCPTTIKFTYP